MSRRDHPDVPRRTSGFSGQIPVRLDGRPDLGPIAGMGVWRGVKDFEHATLCRVFNLDPNRFYFDLPSSVRGVGRMSAGHGGNDGRSRLINGYVFCCGIDEPVGKLTIVSSSDRFKDVDPTDPRDFLDLSHS
ncbi:MAG TPA: hypothetical protein VMN56_03565 [Casimicrobiaceae bacterium]|nr:hypothetical protein [Casimicrobiaceae bacterium]